MEIRRVQMTGGSSYVVTLPKEWISEMRIKKNDPVGLIVQPDGTLIVSKKQRTNRSSVLKRSRPVRLRIRHSCSGS